ncbi:hypothetical protein MELB17_00630 [Marinobacter sp. ELB17]|nr:hypothetical protein MELB17_00630 [Marinobacter sp. ELB17]
MKASTGRKWAKSLGKFRHWGGIQRRLSSDQGEEWGGQLFRGGGFLEKKVFILIILQRSAIGLISPEAFEARKVA